MANSQLRALAPTNLAERWGTTPGKILALIRAGELPAVNIALRTGPGCRPRWRIAMREVLEFERRRSAGPVPSAQAVRREKSVDFVEFF